MAPGLIPCTKGVIGSFRLQALSRAGRDLKFEEEGIWWESRLLPQRVRPPGK
jgi:hypothetical protein